MAAASGGHSFRSAFALAALLVGCGLLPRSRSSHSAGVTGRSTEGRTAGALGDDSTEPYEAEPGTTTRAPFNLILLTIDTLRIDLGFMGYARPVSPNLDALAARSTVFERAYSMASYTGKSIGPMMIGKFASECARDGAHFDTYAAQNTLLAERLQAAGFRTMGVGSHWYFRPKYGLSQGMDVWDLSAVTGQSVNWTMNSAAVTDAAIRLLSDPANVQGRFFLWAHYFDPHQVYLRHPEAPDFAKGAKSAARALYDGEVWYTDHHLGRLLEFIASRPWADRTIVIATADHGEGFGEHGVTGHGVDLWEPLVRVPLVVFVPGVAAHRVPVKRSLVDLVPTVLDLLSLPEAPPGELSGKSTALAILSDGAGLDERDIYLDIPTGPQVSQHRAIIHGTTPGLKLMHEGGPIFFLFDLGKDERESHDLAGDRATLAPMMAAFRERLAAIHEVRPLSGLATARNP